MDAPSANHPERGSLPWLVSGWAIIAAVIVLVCSIIKIFSFHPTAWVVGIYGMYVRVHLPIPPCRRARASGRARSQRPILSPSHAS